MSGTALAERLPDAGAVAAALERVDYLADPGLATAIFLSLRLPQPLLLEGEAGVGKTEAARALAAALGTRLIRLQCYEGMDSAEALYEWNYSRQLLRIRLAESSGAALAEEDLFAREYLLSRPVLEAIEHPGPLPAVLLVDELDRADPDFEAFLLEVLADAAVTIPELGTITATVPPAVILTSNRTRDLHDALKRRCLYHWIDHPSADREVEIVRRRVPGTSPELARDVVAALARLRERRRPEAAGDRGGHRLGRGARAARRGAARAGGGRPHARRGAQVPRGPGGGAGGRARGARGAARVSTFARALQRDPAFTAVALGRALQAAGLPVAPDRSARFATAAALLGATDRDALYWAARLAFVSARDEIPVFDAVFAEVVEGIADPAGGGRGDPNAAPPPPGRRPARERAEPAAGVGRRGRRNCRGHGPGAVRDARAAGRRRGERRGAARRHPAGGARRRRARAGRPAPPRAGDRDAAAAGAALAPVAARGAPRRAGDAAAQPPDRRRPGHAAASAAARAAAAAGGAPRRLRLDGAVRARRTCSRSRARRAERARRRSSSPRGSRA